MSSELAIRLNGLGKCYQIYNKPRERLLQMLVRSRKQYFREFWALRDVSFEVKRGDCLGIVGRNGAGKSTLLQLICGTLTPTSGEISVQGRVAALLELGAGFNPEFTGRENVFLSASVLGLSKQEIVARFKEIVAFSGIEDFIDQPVKTYSSGMYVRLAFSVATTVDPDILIIDEALSVGDGEFARKSFDRIMGLREKGVTILFCSHSMYHIEAICNRACWLEKGEMRKLGEPAEVVTAFSDHMSHARQAVQESVNPAPASVEGLLGKSRAPEKGGRILSITALADGQSGRKLELVSEVSDLFLRVEFVADPSLPSPTIAVAIFTKDGQLVTSTGSLYGDVIFNRDTDGRGLAQVVFPRIPLLKGDYLVSIFLTCERILHVYDNAERYVELKVAQKGLEQGLVVIPNRWQDISG